MLVCSWLNDFHWISCVCAGSLCTLCLVNLLLYFSGWCEVSFYPSISIPFTQQNPLLFIFGIDPRSFSPLVRQLNGKQTKDVEEEEEENRGIHPQVGYGYFGICNSISPVSHGLLIIQAQ